MINLKHEVQQRGYTVAHIKTDSIKIPNADKEIIDFVMEYGKQYGYTFEHEATYSRMCLVNNAVYIAQYKEKDGEPCDKWTATGAQFAVPYIFKTLFSHEPLVFEDKTLTINVTTSLYLDMNESLGEDEHDYKFIGRVSSFCPIIPGHGGGVLCRANNSGKYSSPSGTKGYRWLEAEDVRSLGKEADIDMSYFEAMKDDAIAEIESHGGSFEHFISA